jgi:poly-gamma-glutamate synthesis protein (capsule biosynthesis protein)
MLALCLLTATVAHGAKPFPALYPEADLFATALARPAAAPIPWRVTGLTVPHHLLAADLLAQAFSRLAGQDYRRVIILGPDHFHRSRTPFAVADRDFKTALGPVAVDAEAVTRLAACPLVSASNLFSHEHGIQALTPFLARFFPRASLVAVAIRAGASPAQWDALAMALAPLLDGQTLLVESTDFSHYRPPAQAAGLDQQTLRRLADPDPAGLARLDQPGHVDSRGALYLQRKLQKEVYQAEPVTAANRNSQEYAATPVVRSTSYLVQYYGPHPAALPGPGRYVFAGDAFFGRFMAKLLARPGKRRELIRLVRRATGGAPLVVNLEGVLSPRCPDHPHPYTLCMPQADTLALLRELGVAVAGLANNHARDLGQASLARMRRALARAGIATLAAGEVRDMGHFRLAALTDVDNRDPRRRDLLRVADIDRLAGRGGKKPLFVLMHWGREFGRGPGERERELARELARAGAELVVGAHPHRTWPMTCDAAGCQAWSLGNFLFDQDRPEADGALLEVRFFRQGTYALRLIRLGNPYRDLASGRK